jgi:CubicO group peptidase (beta-lactamase class C family)
MRSQKLPTAGLVIAGHEPAGEVVHSVGPSGRGNSVRSDTRFYFGSFTKVLTAALVCQLADDSRLQLDDTITRFLPHMPFGDITIRQLLSHTAGLVDMYEPVESADALLAKLGEQERIAAPGQIFSYSNAGYVLLGRLVEEISGRTWEENLVARLLKPLAIESTSSVRTDKLAQGHKLDLQSGALVPGDLFPDVGNVMDAAGGRLNGTADDAARLARAIAGGGEIRLLSAKMVAEMLKPHVRVPGVGLISDAWCLGWSLFGHDNPAAPVYGHIGATSALVLVQPQADRSHAVLTNFARGATVGRTIVRDLFAVPLRATRPQPVEASLPTHFADFAGKYGSMLFSIEVAFRDGRLMMTNPMSGEYAPLIHLKDRTFMIDAGEVVTDVTFFPAVEGLPAYVHVALRMLRKLP